MTGATRGRCDTCKAPGPADNKDPGSHPNSAPHNRDPSCSFLMANPDTGLAPWPPGIIGDTLNYTMLVASVPWQPPLTLQGEGNVGGRGWGECLFILEFKPPRCPAGNPSSLSSLPSSPGTHEKSSFQKKPLSFKQEGRQPVTSML